MATGGAVTVKVIDAAPPQPSSNVIVVVPVPVPDITTPLAASMDATATELLLHVPLGDPLSLSVVLRPPEHSDLLPTMATGVAFTEKV